MTEPQGLGVDFDESTRASSLHHVDVERAEAEFNELSRQLSRRSEIARSGSKSSDSTAASGDVEKGVAKDDDRFDLREYLTSSNDAHQKAGIKHKVDISSVCSVPRFILTLLPECRCSLGGSSSRGWWWNG